MSVYQSAPTLEQAAITAKDFNFWYGDFHALTGLDLNIAKNAITSFIGPSGCGKSTFLRCINRMNDLIEGTRVEGTMAVPLMVRLRNPTVLLLLFPVVLSKRALINPTLLMARNWTPMAMLFLIPSPSSCPAMAATPLPPPAPITPRTPAPAPMTLWAWLRPWRWFPCWALLRSSARNKQN